MSRAAETPARAEDHGRVESEDDTLSWVDGRRMFYVALATLLYGAWHLQWYWQTPLGQVPVLDERENVDLALQIAAGTLPAEPFYRAMGYPAILALILRLGVAPEWLPLAATALGLVLHTFNTVLVGRMASIVFRNSAAGVVGGLLHGLNPVLVHYATQVMDGTLANSGLLLGLHVLLMRGSGSGAAALAGLSWAFAAAVRPQMIVLVPAFPVVWWLVAQCPTRPARRFVPLIAGIAGAAVPLVLLGLVQMSIGGEFRVMPTQGAYNLWVANKPGAHGRYLVQSVRLPASAAHENPTRVESRLLYERETGRPGDDIDEVNRHWMARLRESAWSDPAGLIGRLARRVYFLFNDFDQYNNKTYFVHKVRSPALRWNPLGWGVILVTAAVGLIVSQKRYRRPIVIVSALCVITTIPVLLTFVSGRFRLPQVALLCVLGGGVVGWRSWFERQGALALAAAASLVAGIGGVTYSRFAGVHDTRTAVQDHVLMADAAVSVRADAEAWECAGAALTLDGDHLDALAWRLTSYFNLLLSGRASPADEPAWLAAAERYLGRTPDPRDPAINIAALALWRAGRQTQAHEIWRERAQNLGDREAVGALFLSGAISATELSPALGLGAPGGPFLRMAAAVAGVGVSSDPSTVQLAAARAFGR